MKKFKVEGWYCLNNKKYFHCFTSFSFNSKDAIGLFCTYFNNLNFYKITAEELI